MTIRLRLAVAFTALVGLILLLTGAVTYQLLRHSLLTEIQQDVVRRAQSFSRTRSPAPANLNPFAEPDMFLQVDRANGTVAARSANLGTRTLPAPPLILLDNAFKYTPPPGQVWLGAHVTGTEVVITVRDTGLGIPAEDLPHVFDRFCRGRNANTASGTGLGLAIARWIAGQHGGHTDAASTPGEGSAFTSTCHSHNAPFGLAEDAALATRSTTITGRRAFFLTFSITQRDPFRRDWRGATGLEVVLGEAGVDAAGEQRGRGGKISADQVPALCGMCGVLWRQLRPRYAVSRDQRGGR